MRKIAEHIAGACRAGEPLVLVAVAESKDSTCLLYTSRCV